MGNGSRDVTYPGYDGQSQHPGSYGFSHGIVSGMTSWHSLPMFYNMPRTHAELYYFPQPLGVPAPALGAYPWNVYPCQAPLIPGMDLWQGRYLGGPTLLMSAR